MNFLLAFYLWGASVLLLSEYGFQSRRSTMAGFRGRWRWNRSLFRIILFALTALNFSTSWSQWFLLSMVISWLLSEVGASLIRISIQRQFEQGRTHGTPFQHLLPWFFSVLFPLAIFFVKRLTPLDGTAFPVVPALSTFGTLLPLVSLWSWSTVFVVSVVEITRPKQLESDIPPTVGAGEVIGILERYLTILLVLAGGFTAIAFVITAKAAARFPQFNEKEFAEYFLIGTLCSVGLAILAGLLMRGVVGDFLIPLP